MLYGSQLQAVFAGRVCAMGTAIMKSVAVIDYGMGNLRSVAKALEHVVDGGCEIVVTSNPRVIDAAERIVFPGQGAIRDCMSNLRRLGLEGSIRAALSEKPFLGICIGLQALMEGSDEDPGTAGLGIFRGGCRRFRGEARDPATGARIKIPHMGWNRVHQVRSHPLWIGIPDGERFYFVHSYFVAPADPALVMGTSEHGETFACALGEGHVAAVQFHPEKSQRFGLEFLANFIRWRPE